MGDTNGLPKTSLDSSTISEMDLERDGSLTNLDEVALGGVLQNPWDSHHSHGNSHTLPSRPSKYHPNSARSSQSGGVDEEDDGESYDLAELSPIGPIENPSDGAVYRHTSLERIRTRQREQRVEGEQLRQLERTQSHRRSSAEIRNQKALSFNSRLYTHSYLIFFSILGTLAREGLAALTVYPGAPVLFPTIWVNFAGSLIMGFLAEDRMLFLYEWGEPIYDRRIKAARQKESGGESGETTSDEDVDLAAAKKSHLATKKTLPLYIGLSVGFCGSFTTFSTFILDSFLALSNNLETQYAPTADRNKGYSFCALVAVILVTVHLSLGGLFLGAHLAIWAEPITPSLPYTFMRRVVDRLAVILGLGSWIGAILLCIFPPHHVWCGRVLFSLVFAPLGVLTRFYLATHLNGRLPSFPLGTFTANVLGTAILAIVWDLSHVSVAGVVGCQLLKGVQDGYCAVVTTVSTLVLELSSLERKHAYIYGAVSFFVSLGLMVVIAGSLLWTRGLEACTA
ncbi:hypothetical protein NM208_g3180 [Fusarium decemcellulare]|uniref:Uncharacterized protein n=2 Tax=Fusarium decemcellulare TaxID=57161 RepID=A0ACC1S8V8_9HYPO|nr:hypothetical protein NM208_g7485 [Fusarium decemcellulare]KAJ3544219.1 hypothetical protein NM208_g3180 [Fusarium decemcellulare]